MKKRKFGVVIVALILIVAGICLFIGGMIAVGGIKAAKDVIFQHEDVLGDKFRFDIDKDGFDFDIDFDEDGLDFDHHKEFDFDHHDENRKSDIVI